MQDLPLAGLRILITRTHTASTAFAQQLEALGAVPVICPAIEIHFRNPPGLDEALRSLARFDWLTLTSPNAVRAVGARLDALGLDTRATLARVKIAVVGAATEAALSHIGGRAEIVANPANATNLAQRLEAHGITGALVLFPAARIARTELPERLRAAGAGVVQLAVYDTLAPRSLMPPHPDQFDVAIFTSPSAVRNVAAAIEDGWLRLITAICIGPTTAEAARLASIPHPLIAPAASLDGLVTTLKQFMQQREEAHIYGTG